MIKLKWKRMASNLPRPRRAMPTEAGHDLAVIVDGMPETEQVGYHIDGDLPWLTVYPGAMINFGTGWAVEIPPDYFGLVRVRSSVGKARWVLASSGVVDPSFRGEVRIPLLYLGAEPYRVRHGDRMAQMLILPRPDVEDEEVAELTPSLRGAGGFGSTGR